MFCKYAGWFSIALYLLLTVSHAVAAEEPGPPITRTAWFRDAKFGMFVHWGLYSIPAGVWKGRDVPGIGEWIMERGRIPVSEYEPLAREFNPTKFDAEEWVRLARDAGMRYMVVTAKHHDGFCMFRSKRTDYNVVKATPYAKDPMAELVAACRKQDLRFGFFYSIIDWHYPEQKSDFPRYCEYMTEQVGELLENYGPIDVLWFDGEWMRQWNLETGRKLYDYCLGRQPNVLVNNRVGKRSGDLGDFDTAEQSIGQAGTKMPLWELCMTMNQTWGYKVKDVAWKPPAQVIQKLVEVVSKGGNLLLNVGPTAEGVIPEASVKILADVGRWMKVNGESIYASTQSPWPIYPFKGFVTVKGRTLYLHVFEWSEKGIETPALKSEVVSIRAMDPTIQLGPHETSKQAEGYTIRIPKPANPDPSATVVVLELKEPIERPGKAGTDAVKPPRLPEQF